jgi:cell division protein FtsB
VKKSELEATIEALMKENQKLKEQIVKLKRSFEVGDDR